MRLAHTVFNSHDVAQGLAFYEQVLGFRLADRTRVMAFIRIPKETPHDHHSIALADSDNDCLNHIAFVMPDLDSVMRGGGRMKDAGHAIEWGPGRHGPGDNAFNYFIGPSDFVIEYTAEGTYAPGLFLKKGPYKYVYCDTDPGMLFDLKADPLELKNVHEDPAYAKVRDELRAEVFRRWNPPQLKETIIASQQKRHFLRRVLTMGRTTPWDYQPHEDASRMFVRTATVNNPTSIKGAARLPYVAPTPPDFPRKQN